MAAVTEAPLMFDEITQRESSSDIPSDGIASRHLLRGTRVPYTVALLVIGIGLGSLEYGTDHRLGKLGAGIRLWANIDPDLLLAVFLLRFYLRAPSQWKFTR